ncbi:HAD family hydrolase [Chloroflexota bacterium]
MSKISYALFDLDNTLYRGERFHVIYDFPVILHKEGLFNKTNLDELDRLWNGYINGNILRPSFVNKTIESYFHGIKGEKVKEIKLSAKTWLQKSSNLWFEYTFDLMELFKTIPIHTVLVSGSPVEPLEVIKDLLSVDELHATTGHIGAEDEFLGTCRFDFGSKKTKEKLIKSWSFPRESSFAFGDSESDFPLLEAVNPKNSFLLRSNKDDVLGNLGREKGWNVFTHDDDILNKVRERIVNTFYKF